MLVSEDKDKWASEELQLPVRRRNGRNAYLRVRVDVEEWINWSIVEMIAWGHGRGSIGEIEARSRVTEVAGLGA